MTNEPTDAILIQAEKEQAVESEGQDAPNPSPQSQDRSKTLLSLFSLSIAVVALVISMAALLVLFFQPTAFLLERQSGFVDRLSALEAQVKGAFSGLAADAADREQVMILKQELAALQQTLTQSLGNSSHRPVTDQSKATTMAEEEGRPLAQRLAVLEQGFETLKQQGADTFPSVATLNQRVTNVSEAVSLLEARLNAQAANLARTLEGLNSPSLAQVEALETQLANTRLAIVDMEEQLLALHQTHKALTAKVEAQSTHNVASAAKLLAVGRLRDALERGDDVQVEVKALKALVTDVPFLAEALQSLDNIPSGAVPTVQALSQDFMPLWERVHLDVQLAENASNQWGKIWVRARNLVTIQRVDGEAEIMAMEGVEGHLARTNFYLSQGNLGKAMSALKQISPPFDQEIQEFLKALENRDAYERAIIDLDRWSFETIQRATDQPQQ